MIAHQRGNRTGIWLLAGLLTSALGGCVTGASSNIRSVTFSPDGARVAFARDDYAGLGHIYVLASMSWNNRVFWADADAPKRLKRFGVSSGTNLAAFGSMTNGNQESTQDMRFSPDGRYLAIATGSRLTVLDAASGKKLHRVPIDYPPWLGWTWYSADELAWCQATTRPDDGLEVSLLRGKVDRLSAPGEEVARWQRRYLGIETWWSPGGRYAVVSTLAEPGPARLLDVQTSQTHTVSDGDSIVRGVSWRADESAVLVSLERTEVVPWSALVRVAVPELGLARRQFGNAMVTVNLPDGPTDVWEVGGESHIYLPSAAWTADNRFVPSRTNGSRVAAILIDPATRQVIDLTEPICARLGLKAGTEFVWLHALPVAGWLWTVRGDGQVYALDYSATTFVPIARRPWAVSPDGRLLAEVSGSGRLTVRPLALPAADDSIPTSAPDEDRFAPDARDPHSR